MSAESVSEIALEELELLSESNQEMLSAWINARGARSVPFWHDFDPLDVAPLVAQCIFLKRRAEDDWLITMFGSKLVARFGHDFTGTNGVDLVDAADRTSTIARMNRLVDEPVILRSLNQVKTSMHAPVMAEWILLPFANEDGGIDHTIHVISTIELKTPSRPIMEEPTVGRRILELNFVKLT